MSPPAPKKIRIDSLWNTLSNKTATNTATQEMDRSTLIYRGAALRITFITGKIPMVKKLMSIMGLCENPKGSKNSTGANTQ